MAKKTVGVLGATGTVGQRIIHMLDGHPWYEVTSLHGGSTAGKVYGDTVRWLMPGNIPEKLKRLKVKPTKPEEADVDFVFSALPSDVAKKVEPRFAEAGLPVVSNASAYRMSPDVPLVVPEVNPGHVRLVEVQRERRGWDGFIATDPNCSTINFVLALKPLVDAFQIRRVIVTTMQAVSGAGYPGLPSLDIIENVVPYIGGEEEKLETEPLKIFGALSGDAMTDAGFKVSAQCNRVPCLDGHVEAVYLEAAEELELGEVKRAFSGFKGEAAGLGLPTAPVDPVILREEPDRPQTRLDRLAGSVPGMAVSVGRVRHGLDRRSLRFVCLGHNTIRGAAGGAVMLAELLTVKGYI